MIPPERTVPVTDATVLVFGLGRIGTYAYDALRNKVGDTVVGFDVDEAIVASHETAGRRVFLESATDADFWERLHVEREQIRLILLAMHSHDETVSAVEQLRIEGFDGYVAATATYEDEVAELQAVGANYVFHTLKDAGPAFAYEAMRLALNDEAPSPDNEVG